MAIAEIIDRELSTRCSTLNCDRQATHDLVWHTPAVRHEQTPNSESVCIVCAFECSRRPALMRVAHLVRRCTDETGHLAGADHRWQECPTYA